MRHSIRFGQPARFVESVENVRRSEISARDAPPASGGQVSHRHGPRHAPRASPEHRLCCPCPSHCRSAPAPSSTASVFRQARARPSRPPNSSRFNNLPLPKPSTAFGLHCDIFHLPRVARASALHPLSRSSSPSPVVLEFVLIAHRPNPFHALLVSAVFLVLSTLATQNPLMGRRANHKGARKKNAKRQRAAEKRAERARNRLAAQNSSDPAAANHRITLLRDAVIRGDAPAPRGLTNLGNTCFFNAVMQNLARVAAFRDYFVGGAPGPGEGPLTSSLRSFFVAMWDLSTSSVLNPSDLFTEVGKKNPSFRGRAQQDSHELMRVLFDGIIEEEKQRLSKVHRGILPSVYDVDSSDTSSEGCTAVSSSSTESGDDCLGSDENPLIVIGPQLPIDPISDNAKGSTITESSNSRNCNSKLGEPVLSEQDNESASEPEKIPPEKLQTIIERTFGGTLSSTIVCKECGFKSSVTEPFLDLQLPLVPKEVEEESNTNDNSCQSDDNTLIRPVKANVCNDITAKPSNLEHSQLNKPVTVPPKVAALPPPPPPPLPPKRSDYDASVSTPSGDPMKELRTKVIPFDAEPPQENRLILHPSVTSTEMAPSSDTEAVIEDDDTDSYCLPSLFDDDIDDESDPALDDVKSMTAFSTAEAAKSQGENKVVISKPASTATTTRRSSSFISSFFGGFGTSAAAPYGYKSIIGSLEDFMKIERLDGDNAYGCEECTRREKLRVALQRKRVVTKRSAVKIRPVPTEITAFPMADSASEPGSDNSNHLTSAKAEHITCKAPNVSFENALSLSRENRSADIVSSPVTSSESSSSICSEDDGELIVEEELETDHIDSNVLAAVLSREEEDKLLKDVKVDIPTVRTTAEKRFMIREAPDVLAIQLKRFMQTGFRGGLRKISGSVAFPVRLNISDFVEDAREHQNNSHSGMNVPNVAKRKRKDDACAETKKSKYDYILTGVCVHGGSLTGGHYTAYVREGVESDSRGGWYLCNDSKISRASEKDVLNSEPYLLYYARV